MGGPKGGGPPPFSPNRAEGPGAQTTCGVKGRRGLIFKTGADPGRPQGFLKGPPGDTAGGPPREGKGKGGGPAPGGKESRAAGSGENKVFGGEGATAPDFWG